MIDYAQIKASILPHIPEILQQHNIEYSEFNSRLAMPCFIHGGDKEDALSISLSTGYWACYTRHCEQEYKSANIISLLQALLHLSHTDTIVWIANYLHKTLDQFSIENNQVNDFMYLKRYLDKKIKYHSQFYPRLYFIKDLIIPSPYFISRGFSPDILRAFDVGDCNNPEDKKFNRAIVPCYDEYKKYVVGYHGRSIFEKCVKCGLYHGHEGCPVIKENKLKCSKWKMGAGFNADAYFYNEWNLNAELGYAILVEGAGEVWKLEEAGIQNSLALFGTKFTENQLCILNAYPLTTLILALDNDEAGNKCRSNITYRCRKSFKIKHCVTNLKDFGEMSPNEIRTIFEGVI